MANPMYVLDERMVEMIFDYCRQRLALDPVSLDFGGARESFDDVLSGLIGESGNDPEAVLALFSDHLATAVVSCDSPRFLAFIPAAPDQGGPALRHDRVVLFAPGHVVVGGGGGGGGGEPGARVPGRPGRPAPRGGRVLRVGRVDRQPLGPGRGARHRRAASRTRLLSDRASP